MRAFGFLLFMLVITVASSGFGIPGLKQALDWVGYYGGPPRSPLGPLGERDRAELRRVLRESRLL